MILSKKIKREQRDVRMAQIKAAAVKLFDTIPYHEITLAKIAAETEFTRGNLYKYITSKEEIFLYVITDEIRAWVDNLNAVFIEKATDYRAFALSWAKTASIYSRLLKLSALLLTVFEENVPLEKLVEFKKNMITAIAKVHEPVKTAFPHWSDEKIYQFIHMQNCYVIGLYPYSAPSAKQKKAAELTGTGYVFPKFIENFSDFIYCIVCNFNTDES
jgi:AcrR family transcriptional regulator